MSDQADNYLLKKLSIQCVTKVNTGQMKAVVPIMMQKNERFSDAMK